MEVAKPIIRKIDDTPESLKIFGWIRMRQNIR